MEREGFCSLCLARPMRNGMERGRNILFLSVFLISLVSFSSAGLFDIFTGKASDAPQDVSVSVQGNSPPTVNYVEDLNSISPSEGGVKNVILEAHVRDQDGVNNIDDSSVDVEFTSGAITRAGSCVFNNDIDTRVANYTCSVLMQYYDSAGNWNINVSGRDLQGNYAENTSEVFSYSLLSSFATPLSPSTLNWPALAPGASNQQSNNDPTTVTNTGNYAGNIFITAYDLIGETDLLENISATSFSVSSTSGSECTGTALGPDGSSVNTGISANPGGAPAQIYYCIQSVPPVSSQTYSTLARGLSWMVEYV